MQEPSYIFVGSSNTDPLVPSVRLLTPSKTVLGGSFSRCGWKMANQALAARHLGVLVNFIARIGDDLFGDRANNCYRVNSNFHWQC